ncbi:hypothetical protein N657DRAFT_443033 [Parathielavia appendiculata]|uniref:Uncharacterized protein n=1 Tax=Parathielavia appendiculata TaxID=2587402 RepID=A0AAN6YY55_9PEZI|nr:hypothetical protein N657DRAFT_443033 [Parathielavia appendiculata]
MSPYFSWRKGQPHAFPVQPPLPPQRTRNNSAGARLQLDSADSTQRSPDVSPDETPFVSPDRVLRLPTQNERPFWKATGHPTYIPCDIGAASVTHRAATSLFQQYCEGDRGGPGNHELIVRDGADKRAPPFQTFDKCFALFLDEDQYGQSFRMRGDINEVPAIASWLERDDVSGDALEGAV